MNLGKIIKSCRVSKGLTQSQLSELTDISVSHICLMEKNKREPTLSKLESIAQALNMPLSVLVFLASQNNEVDEFNKEQIEELSKNLMGLMDVAYKQKKLF